jgi:hypothetical protein
MYLIIIKYKFITLTITLTIYGLQFIKILWFFNFYLCWLLFNKFFFLLFISGCIIILILHLKRRFINWFFFQISLINLKILGFIICALSVDLLICCHNFKRRYRFDFEILVFASQAKSSILLSICLLCLNELFGFAKVFRL